MDSLMIPKESLDALAVIFIRAPAFLLGFFSHRKAASYDSFCIFTSFQMKPGLQVQIWIHYEFSYLPSHSIIYTVDVVD